MNSSLNKKKKKSLNDFFSLKFHEDLKMSSDVFIIWNQAVWSNQSV